jgi:hypothetical protein
MLEVLDLVLRTDKLYSTLILMLEVLALLIRGSVGLDLYISCFGFTYLGGDRELVVDALDFARQLANHLGGG